MALMDTVLTRSRTALILVGLVVLAALMGSPIPELAIAFAGIFAVIEWITISWNTQHRLTSISGLVYIILALIAGVWIQVEFGLVVTFWLLTSVWAADTFAFFAGSRFGGPKLAPAISPAKTWSGVGGGLVGCVFVSLFFQLTGLLDIPYILVCAILIAVGAVLGDLLESWVKRRMKVKDTSSLLPGHGGMLDRIDGVLAVWLGTAVVLLCLVGFTG